MEELSGGGDRERERSFTWETPCYDDPGGQTDLILAAKLGKSLLEQNEELSAEYYKIVRKLEVSWESLRLLCDDICVVDCHSRELRA